MSTTQDIKRGQIWRRIKDGTLVEIDEVVYDMHGILVDVIWCQANVHRARRRACNSWDFSKLYELVDGGDGR